jgi:APA family basic amino acid/polyamine antiporter
LDHHKKRITFATATSVVIANMIGTGVFTSLGFQLFGIKSLFSILLLWLLGGIISLCGALSYGELGAAFPRSGGEYNYLSKLYHPFIGFLSGWVSATVGFAAPVALSAMLLGGYFTKVFPYFDAKLIASSVVILLTIIHATSIKHGSRFQNIFTALKVILIIVIVIAGLTVSNHQNVSIQFNSSTLNEIISPSFAISLFFVSYSYSGWNAAAYIAGEIKEPQKNLPRALFVGTLVVTILYVLLNYVFMINAPISEMIGQPEVAYFPAQHIFGLSGANVISMVISILLVSSVSSMVLAGPRVIHVIGEDIKMLQFFGKLNKEHIPVIAIVTQCVITLIFIATSTFEQVITYLGFTLNLFTFFTVLGIFILRRRNISKTESPNFYKAWGYPFTSILFLVFGLWLMVYGIIYKPSESLLGLATLLIGAIIYLINLQIHKNNNLNLHVEP